MIVLSIKVSIVDLYNLSLSFVIVSLVKSALHTAIPSILTGRQYEITRIKEFLLNHVTTETPGSLYISGPPGTGKTAAVTKYLTNPEV